MGQHKYNPTAIAAKNGELPPKKLAVSSDGTRQLLGKEIAKQMFCYSPETVSLMTAIRNDYR